MPRTTRSTSYSPTPLAALCLVSLLTSCSVHGEALARQRRPLRERLASSLPAADAAPLGLLAPPARLSTLRENYGDAPFARDRMHRAADAATHLAPRFGCAPLAQPTLGGGCAISAPGRRRASAARMHTFAPAYVSSPLVDADSRSPLLSPATAFLWAVDGLTDVPAR